MWVLMICNRNYRKGGLQQNCNVGLEIKPQKLCGLGHCLRLVKQLLEKRGNRLICILLIITVEGKGSKAMHGLLSGRETYLVE